MTMLKNIFEQLCLLLPTVRIYHSVTVNSTYFDVLVNEWLDIEIFTKFKACVSRKKTSRDLDKLARSLVRAKMFANEKHGNDMTYASCSRHPA